MSHYTKVVTHINTSPNRSRTKMVAVIDACVNMLRSVCRQKTFHSLFVSNKHKITVNCQWVSSASFYCCQSILIHKNYSISCIQNTAHRSRKWGIYWKNLFTMKMNCKKVLLTEAVTRTTVPFPLLCNGSLRNWWDKLALKYLKPAGIAMLSYAQQIP